MKNEAICARDKDFALWYTDVCKKAELMDYSSVKGFIIYRPYGYAIWENIQKYLDKKFKETGHSNVYMPMLIPESLLQKEKDHVEGFAPECAVVTKGGYENLEEHLIVRPTSETLFCEHFSKIVNSYRDLPLKYNQWCSVVRWEKTTRPFLRGSEFLWQEGHTIHTTKEEAMEETLDMLDVYTDMAKELLAIPMVTGLKTEKEKFSGAEATYTIEALMHDKRALQSGTTHFFGDGFARAFDIKYLDKDNTWKYVFQTSWGVSTRLLGALIMVHGDDNGLVLPPVVAPTQVIIVPIKYDAIKDDVDNLYEELKAQGYRVKLDLSDKSPGYKFADAEMRGIPFRIEIGPRDLENGEVVIARRDTGVKESVKLEEVNSTLEEFIPKMQKDMYEKALKFTEDNTHEAETYDEFKKIIAEDGGFVKIAISDSEEVEVAIKDETKATARCIVGPAKEGIKCVYSGAPAIYEVLFAKAY